MIIQNVFPDPKFVIPQMCFLCLLMFLSWQNELCKTILPSSLALLANLQPWLPSFIVASDFDWFDMILRQRSEFTSYSTDFYNNAMVVRLQEPYWPLILELLYSFFLFYQTKNSNLLVLSVLCLVSLHCVDTFGNNCFYNFNLNP